MFDLVELYTHWQAGRGQREMAASLAIDRKTIRKYVAPAIAEGITPGVTAPLTAGQWAAKAAEWFPALHDPAARAVTWPGIAEHAEKIQEWLAAEVTVATIAQRLRDEHGLVASESSVRRWVAAHFADEVAREKVTVPRGAVEPGSEAQIDYGKLGMWTDPATGKRVAVWAFVMVLSHSRHLFVQPVLRMDQTSWCASHVAAFEFFGGIPARLVIDNLKTGVDKPDLYDPKLNRTYGELAVHYGTLVDPARAGKPKDKPRVERPMQYVRDSFWRGREFTSIIHMQAEAVRWSSQVAGLRNSRALDGGQPIRVFEAVEAAALAPLPGSRFEISVWSTGKVGMDTHLKIGKALYSVPWRLIGQTLHARTCGDIVQIFRDQHVVATHVLHLSGRATNLKHYPPEKIAFRLQGPTWCRKIAAEIGPACELVIGDLLSPNAIHHLRAAQGILRLREKHGLDRVEAACARAIDADDPSYRTVKGILAAGTDTDDPIDPTGSRHVAAVPAFLRGPDQFGDHPAA
jgi:transposase